MRRSEPGARFSTTTSHVDAMSKNICLPLGFFRSMVTLFTPWVRLRNLVEISSSVCFWVLVPWAPAKGPLPRTGSPLPGISTLITSAPIRARFMDAKGPARYTVTARTFISLSGSISLSLSAVLAIGVLLLGRGIFVGNSLTESACCGTIFFKFRQALNYA